jgi:hypothetical protein
MDQVEIIQTTHLNSIEISFFYGNQSYRNEKMPGKRIYADWPQGHLRMKLKKLYLGMDSKMVALLILEITII